MGGNYQRTWIQDAKGVMKWAMVVVSLHTSPPGAVVGTKMRVLHGKCLAQCLAVSTPDRLTLLPIL